jgi:hyaluronoglucosaminidase
MSGSPFAVRGVIEGFYGNPWTQAQRLDMVDWLAAHGMNTFVYGPKDDPLVRRNWREPYTGDALERLRELADRCAARGIEFVYCIAPGLSIRYSDDGDVAALCAKLDAVRALGATGLAVLLDDIPRVLQHEQDKAAFADIADAHAALLRAVREHLGPETWLIGCPLDYHGTADEPYVGRLARQIDPAIDLFWTGRQICSAQLTLEDARHFAQVTGRPPLYWDNYPVNDVAMGWELHVGPYLGRDERLAECSRGIIANPMELYEASKIPLGTIAAYLADPAGYEPEAAWRRAVADVAGADADAFALIGENTRSSCLEDVDAPTVTAALEACLFEADQGRDHAASERLARLAEGLAAAADRLLATPANPELAAECRPWLEAAAVGADAMRTIATLAADGRLERDARAELRPYLVELRRRRVRIFGDALDMTLSDLTDTHVRPGELTLPNPGGEEG